MVIILLAFAVLGILMITYVIDASGNNQTVLIVLIGVAFLLLFCCSRFFVRKFFEKHQIKCTLFEKKKK